MSQIDTNYPEGPLTNKLIGLAFKTFNSIGPGYAEKIYQNLLRDYFDEENVKYVREKYAKLIFNNKIIGIYRIDFLIEDRIVVAIKSREELFKKDIHQVLNYLKFYKLKVSLIFCFGKFGVKIKRLIN